MIRVNEIKLSLDEDISLIKEKLVKKLSVKAEEIIEYKIFRESIDARKNICFVYTVDVSLKNEDKILKRNKQLKKSPQLEYEHVENGKEALKNRPVIIGMGPAGMFAGLLLSQRGYKPIILERGEDVDTRSKDVEEFFTTRKFNKDSNVQFGEGGAGTFSDGKLTTRIKDKRCRKVLDEFVKFGAPDEILYIQKPHIGTDILKNVVKNIRKSIEDLGGEVRFKSKVTDFFIEDEKIKAIQINGCEKIETSDVILAIGHSARDTYERLHERHVKISQKPFSIGVRIEHPQKLINKSQYKDFSEHKRLGAADYSVSYKCKNGRGVYTFCMCPGGVVVAANSEENMVVTNGMSEYARDQENANSALLVQINTEDFASHHPLAGVEFQRKWERKAFKLGGEDYSAPAQLVGDFINGTPSKEFGKVKPSYLPNVKLTNLRECLPEYVVESMKEAIVKLDKKLKGFAMDEGIMTGVETRSSAPIRIDRNRSTMESINVEGIYPTGEGAGYAGGIVSASVDGIKAAEMIIKKYKPFG